MVSRKHDRDGSPVGKPATNPLLDTREYMVEFVDGSTHAYAANVIAETMYSQVDSEGHSLALLKEINDHRKDGSAVSPDDAWIENASGRRFQRRTTRGWDLNVV